MRLSLRTILSTLLLAAPLALHAQGAAPASTGRIVGRVIDAATGQGITDVTVQVVGTTTGTMSGIEGRFTLPSVAAGTVTLQARRIGYAPKTVTGIFVEPGKTVEQNISLAQAAAQLSAQMVTAAAERGSVSEALDAQRTSSGIVNAVTAEQIQKSPDGDAAQAVQRVSGVTVQDGKYVFVRGLGERYTTSSVNGARVPSPEPEKRVVPLDMFPAGLLQSITTSKTFTPDQQGDFSGAAVDIRTREFPARRSWTGALGSGYFAGATGATLLTNRNVGGESFGMVGRGRELPPLLRAVGNFQGLSLSQGDMNLLVKGFRNAWTPTASTGAPNLNGSFSVGGNDPILFGHRLGYLVSGTFSNSTDLKDNQVRALADRGNVRGTTREIDRFAGQTSTQSVLWGGLTNLSTLIGKDSRLSLNGLYNRTADNEARVESGAFENEGIRARISRLGYVERSVQSLQLAGEHQASERHRFDWAATASGVSRYEPDRSEIVQVIEKDTPTGPDVLRWLSSSNAGAVRTFSALDERSREARANYQFNFRAFGQSHSLKVGGLTREVMRTADTRAYSISANGASNAIRELAPELLFDGRFTQPNSKVFQIAPLSQGGAYDAHDRISAGYLMSELGFSTRIRVITGARFESDRLTVNAVSTLGSPVSTLKQWDDLLPSLAVNVKLTDAQQLRISGSQTLARPEYRELSPIKSRDVLNGDDTEGNKDLARTRIVNADLRWEWYPESGEIISVGLFGKTFDKPIERVYRAAGSGTRTVFYTNADKAENYGVELEVRKNLGQLGRMFDPITVFSNVTVMRSTIHLGTNTQASATNLSRAMVGQAPYVVNGGITFSSRSGNSSATVLFNRIGERIYAAGDSPLPDVVEQPRSVLDLSLRLAVTRIASLRLDAKNVLNAPYKVQQGSVTRDTYTTGTALNVGITVRP